MYNPASFAEHDLATLHAFIQRQSFATLISTGDGGLVASHLPLLLDTKSSALGLLFGHMARANSQWRRIDGEVLAVFHGPHTYISPAWYEEPGLVVPTWNYVAVHVHGCFQPIEEREELLNLLRRSIAFYEGSRPQPWSLDIAGERLEGLLRSIVGFRIEISRIEGKWKLSQNHSEERRRRLIRALREQEGDDARTIVTLMEQTLTGSEREHDSRWCPARSRDFTETISANHREPA
jgi:transcriptional regulator